MQYQSGNAIPTLQLEILLDQQFAFLQIKNSQNPNNM